MGNICSKSANKPDNFSSPGRTLGASSQPPKPTSVPVPQKLTTSTPGRTLASGENSSSPEDARAAAAKAAEQRAANLNKPGSGKLATNLQNQKKQTQNQLLNASSESERRARDADQGAEARNWN